MFRVSLRNDLLHPETSFLDFIFMLKNVNELIDEL